MTGSAQVNLDGSTTPQVVVAAVGTPTSTGSGDSQFVPSTVLLLAWDATAKRWTAVFDASKQSSYQTSLQDGTTGSGLLDLTDRGPRFAEIRDQPNGRADLVYWLKSIQGNSSVLIVGVVHLANEIANVVWNFNGDEGHSSLSDSAAVAVVGHRPHQQVKLTLPWQTSIDARSDAVRDYSFTVAPDPKSTFDEYVVTSDDRPLVGVGLLSLPDGRGEVAYLPPTSPAKGVLQPGDIIDGIDGLPSSANRDSLGPTVVDQVAQHHPGDSIKLDIERQGQRRVVTLRLGEWNFTASEVGYTDVFDASLGVRVEVRGTSLVIANVVANGPAQAAGISGDSTITAVDGLPIHTLTDLQAALAGRSAGDTLPVTYVAPNGSSRLAQVALGAPSTTPLDLYTM